VIKAKRGNRGSNGIASTFFDEISSLQHPQHDTDEHHSLHDDSQGCACGARQDIQNDYDDMPSSPPEQEWNDEPRKDDDNHDDDDVQDDEAPGVEQELEEDEDEDCDVQAGQSTPKPGMAFTSPVQGLLQRKFDPMLMKTPDGVIIAQDRDELDPKTASKGEQNMQIVLNTFLQCMWTARKVYSLKLAR
jgi:hypothetical protein